MIEMLMAISVMAIIGMSVAAASMAMTNAYDSGQEYYECLQTGRITALRLEQTLRKALLVTDVADEAVWIWREDTDGDGQINLSEVSMIGRDSRTNELVEYYIEFPGYASDLDDVINPSQATADYTAASRGSYPAWTIITVLAENVSAFAVSVAPDAPTTTTIGITLTVAQGGREMTIRSAVNLRADWTNRLAWVVDSGWPDGGYWVLTN